MYDIPDEIEAQFCIDAGKMYAIRHYIDEKETEIFAIVAYQLVSCYGKSQVYNQQSF